MQPRRAAAAPAQAITNYSYYNARKFGFCSVLFADDDHYHTRPYIPHCGPMAIINSATAPRINKKKKMCDSVA